MEITNKTKNKSDRTSKFPAEENFDANGRFKKGNKIAHLGGRPKGSVSLVGILKDKLQEVPKGKEKTYAQLMIDRWINEALVKGDFAALREAVRYTDGMPKQTVENRNIDIDNAINNLEDQITIDEEIKKQQEQQDNEV